MQMEVGLSINGTTRSVAIQCNGRLSIITIEKYVGEKSFNYVSPLEG
jgi:hypothetical protein